MYFEICKKIANYSSDQRSLNCGLVLYLFSLTCIFKYIKNCNHFCWAIWSNCRRRYQANAPNAFTSQAHICIYFTLLVYKLQLLYVLRAFHFWRLYICMWKSKQIIKIEWYWYQIVQVLSMRLIILIRNIYINACIRIYIHAYIYYASNVSSPFVWANANISRQLSKAIQ